MGPLLTSDKYGCRIRHKLKARRRLTVGRAMLKTRMSISRGGSLKYRCMHVRDPQAHLESFAVFKTFQQLPS